MKKFHYNEKNNYPKNIGRFFCTLKSAQNNNSLFIKITFVFILGLITTASKAQDFYSQNGAIQNTGQNTNFPIIVSGLVQSQLDSTFGFEHVCLDISHPDIRELNIYLQSPSGIIIMLSQGTNCYGSNYSGTCFKSSANTSITLGNSPYSGTYKPLGYLGRFNAGEAGNGTWLLIIKDWNVNGNSGTLNSGSISFGYAPAPPVILTSSNLPVVFLSAMQVITGNKSIINMGIVDNGSGRNHVSDNLNGYNGKAQISLHGSSTLNFEKKCYSFTTCDLSANQLDVPLLGMPTEHDWELLGPYQDKSLIRIPLAYDLARRMGHYAARFKNVELILNNEYQGVYALMEKIKRDSNRVHVSKIATTDNSFPAISGGYIMKIDRDNSPGWYSFAGGNCQNGKHFFYQYEYPKGSDITVQQQNYIKSYVDSFEMVMDAPNFSDPNTGYRNYIHTGSFIDYFIINELSKNVDAYRFSTYMYKDNISHGGKLHIGPVWDFDIAWHNCSYGNADSPIGWEYLLQDTVNPSPRWWGRFFQDSNFVDQLSCRWTELRKTLLSDNYLMAYVDSSANALNESQQRNFVQWPILGARVFPNPQNQSNATYSGEVDDLKNWIHNRAAWMDNILLGHCYQTTVIKENNRDNILQVYPNPMELGTTFLLNLTAGADVSISVMDGMGKEVTRFLNSRTPVGESKIDFDRKQIPSGVYFYQVQINNEIKRGKLIIQ